METSADDSARRRPSNAVVTSRLQAFSTLIKSDGGHCPTNYSLVDGICAHSALIALHSASDLSALVSAYEAGAAAPYLPGMAPAQPAISPAVSPPEPVTAIASGVTVVDIFGTFTISGTTAEELRASLNRTGTIGGDGKRYDGYTRTNISWRWGWTKSGAGCQVFPVAVRLEVRETMPHWSAVSWATPGLEAQWKRYIAALQVHEDGHRQIGLDHAHKIRQRLEALPPQPTCDEAGAKANTLGMQLLKDLPQADREYDRITRSGETQGARL